MLTQINGLHHVTAIASAPQANNDFFTRTLGLRRVKKTVNFDAPEVYHLYYGDTIGTPGSVMTYFPFLNPRRSRPGTGEVGETAFAVPEASLDWWQAHLTRAGVAGLARDTRLGEPRLTFAGPDGETLALVARVDARTPWTGAGIGDDVAIRGFHSVTLRLADGGAMAELLGYMGYARIAQSGTITRFQVPEGNGADLIDLDIRPDLAPAREGGGSVHHVAFSVADSAAQVEVRRALADTGWQVTPVIDRDYFKAIYFRTPGGVLFEVATDTPGFTRDEPSETLGQALKLPQQHEALRATLEARHLPPIHD